MVKKAIRGIKMIGVFFGILVLTIVIIATLFFYFSPEFGGTHSKERKERYSQSANYQNGLFKNLGNITMHNNISDYPGLILKYFSKQPDVFPSGTLPLDKIDSLSIVNYNHDKTRIIWFGHSTVLIQVGGKNLLIDPMFGQVAAPHPWLGAPRFNKELPIEIEQLPQIDAVIFSHDHYDHLDYGSLIKLKDKVKAFYTPLGVGAHLESWGIAKSQIKELDWWQETAYEGINLVCTPAQHFSGRGLADRNTTLWSSWIIQSDSTNLFFSGDSGYGPHFKEIGDRYGPFDFAMMECGQYNQQWIQIHMLPENTVQASIDIQAALLMPIHWGAFKLALHPWTDPIQRVTKKATEEGVAITTPKIGEEIILKDSIRSYPNSKWWIGI